MTDIQSRIREFLLSPNSKGIEDGINTADQLIEDAKKELKLNASNSRSVGPLIGKLNSVKNTLANLSIVDWVNISNGKLAIGHRPGAKLLESLKLQGATHILTLLCESEGALEVKKLSNKFDLQWVWFSMESAKELENSRVEELKQLFEGLQFALNDGAQIYIHCSAGIHRTGMISFALLRYLGLDNELAIQTLQQLRNETEENVGAHRIEWASSLFEGD